MDLLIKYNFRVLFLLALGLALQACSGSDSSSTPDTSDGAVVLSGLIQVESSDASGKPINAISAVAAKVGLSNASVSLYKMSPDGTESQVASTTADSNGNYTLSDVPVAQGGSGNNSDFYYEIRASSGSLDVRAPAAPNTDTTVNVNPETNLAAKIISDVMDIPTSSTQTPTPNLDIIDATRNLVEQNAIALASEITIPSVATTSASDTSKFANGISAAGGNAEKMFKALQFNSESLWLMDTSNTVTTDQAGAYIKRIVRESCNQPSENPIPDEAANVIGAALVAGTTYTATEIVTAYNTATSTTVDEATMVAAYKVLLTAIDANLSATSSAASNFTAGEQLALFSKRALSGTAFAATSSLDADQATTFIFSFPGSGNYCNLVSANIVDILAALTGSSSLALAQITDAQVYHNSGFGCSSPDGHFMAEVKIYVPTGITVTSVDISSSDSTALGGDGSETLSSNGNRWVSNNNAICVNLDSASSVTYTITANLSSGGTLTKMITRNHPSVPEAIASVGGATASKDFNNPDIVTDKRPLYSWQDPSTVLATIPTAPSGSKIKYTYEFSHIDTNPGPDVQIGPLPQCDSVLSGALYEVNSFIPKVDCDPVACATAASRTATDISCRINIQTFLVNDSDDYLGQAAGNFTFYCVDINADGVCGD